MTKFLANNSAGWSLFMSDDSTKPTEVTPDTAVVAVVKPEAEESAVKLSPDEAQAWLEKSEKFVKLVAENLRYGSLTKRFVTIGGVAFLAFNPMSAGKVAEVFGVRELPKWYVPAFGLGMGGILVGAVGAAIVTLPKRTLEAVPERQAIKGLRSFELKDAEIFKRLERGRDVQDCLDALDTPDLRLFLLMGESGVGKSSLLQAGLMPNFGKVGLAGVYVKLGDRDPMIVIRKAIRKEIWKEVGECEGSLVEMLRSAGDRAGKPIVLMLDQFEQFFVQFREEARGAFIGELKAWYESDVNAKILIGIRGDLSDRLVEIQKALGYAVRPSQVHRLEKFAPEQATAVLRVMAETEKWSFNEAFVLEMVRDELAGVDGKVAPVEVQVLAQMVSWEPSEENRRFDKTSFQKLGGVDGLLGRSLQRSLQSLKGIMGKSSRDRALEVLLALTDLERNVRSGAFSIAQLHGMTEKVHGSPSDVESAIGWLAESRLVTPAEGDDAVRYELAHERLIPALRVVAKRELSDANRANLLLDRRVNEWLGSGKSGRYLFSVKELWLLRQQRGFLEWGVQRSQKEALVRRSWGRLRWGIGNVSTPLALGLAFGVWSYTPPGQIQWARWDLVILRNMRVSSTSEHDEVTKSITVDLVSGVGNNPFPTLWMKWFVSESCSDEEFSRIIDLVSKSKDKASARQILRQAEIIANHFNQPILLSKTAEALIVFGDAEKGKQTLEKALEITKSINKDENNQGKALSSIAQVYGKLGNAEKGKQTLEKALEITKSIKDEYSQITALSLIGEAYGKLGDAERGRQILEKALEITKLFEDEYFPSRVLSSIAEAYGKLGDAEKGKQILEKVLAITKSIKNEYFQSRALSSIVKASGKLGDAEKRKQILEKTVEITKSIKTEYLQSDSLISIVNASGKLGDAEKGKQILGKTIELTKSIKTEYLQSDALSSIAQAYLELGDRDRAKAIASELSSKSKPELSSSETNKNLGILQAELGNWGEALRFSKHCQIDNKVAVLTRILRVNAEQKHPEFKELRIEKEE